MRLREVLFLISTFLFNFNFLYVYMYYVKNWNWKMKIERELDRASKWLIWYIFRTFGFTQSHWITYLPIIVKNTLWDPTKYIYLESARQDLQNGVKILFIILVGKKFLKNFVNLYIRKISSFYRSGKFDSNTFFLSNTFFWGCFRRLVRTNTWIGHVMTGFFIALKIRF